MFSSYYLMHAHSKGSQLLIVLLEVENTPQQLSWASWRGGGPASASHGEKGRKKRAFCLLVIDGGKQRDRDYTKSPVPRPTIVADVREWVISRARTQGRLGTETR